MYKKERKYSETLVHMEHCNTSNEITFSLSHFEVSAVGQRLQMKWIKYNCPNAEFTTKINEALY